MNLPMKIDFVSDVSCPWCVIGLKALETAIAQLGDTVKTEIHFQPFELNPTMPPEGKTSPNIWPRNTGPRPNSRNRRAR